MFSPERRSIETPLGTVFLALCCTFVYGRSLFFEILTWDDTITFLSNPILHKIKNGGIFSILANYGRTFLPVRDVSYLIDHVVFHAHPFAAHAHNLALFFIFSLLAILFLKNLYAGSFWYVAAAAIFLLHPTKVEPVVWISGRKDLLAGIFILLSLLWVFRRTPETSFFSWNTLTLVLFSTAAFFSKSSALILPAAVAVFLYIRGVPLKKIGQIIGPLAAIALIACCIQIHTARTADILQASEMDHSIRDIVKLPAFYFKTLFFPYGLCHVYYFAPPTWLDVATTLLILGMLGISILTIHAPRERAAMICGCLFLVPYLQIIPTTHLAADRYLFMATLTFAVIVTAGLRWLYCRSRWGAITTLLALGILWGVPNLHYQQTWKDDIALWNNASQIFPDRPAPRFNLGAALIEKQHYNAALAVLSKNARLFPYYLRNQNALGVLFLESGRLDEAETVLKELALKHPDYPAGTCNYALLLYQRGNRKDGIHVAERCQKLDPKSSVFSLYGLR